MDKAYLSSLLWENWFVRRVVYPVVVLYLLLLLFAVSFSDCLLYHPTRCDPASVPNGITLTTSDGTKVSAVYLPNEGATYTFLYSHGNGENLSECTDCLASLRDMGFAVFAYDYNQYGASQGRLNEQGVYRDIDAAYAYLTGTLRVPPDRIIIYGHSLGGGPSVDLAARKPAAGLILQSVFTSVYCVFTRVPLLPFDKYRNLAKIRRVHCPVLIMHGTADDVIPYQLGRQLYRAAHAPKQCLWVTWASHNNLEAVAGDRYREAVLAFAQSLPVPKGVGSAQFPTITGNKPTEEP